jgi:hypothetical protein
MLQALPSVSLLTLPSRWLSRCVEIVRTCSATM